MKRLIIVMMFLTLILLGLFACQTALKAEQKTMPVPPTTTSSPTTAPTTEAPVVPLPKPASFHVSNLVITPTEIISGSSIRIQVTVTNSGESSGNYTVSLNIDNAEADSEIVTLAAGASQNVTFAKFVFSAKVFSVSIGDQSTTFVVVPPPPASPTTTMLTPVPPIPEPTPVPMPVSLEGLQSLPNVVNISLNDTLSKTNAVQVLGKIINIDGRTVTLSYKRGVVSVFVAPDTRFITRVITVAVNGRITSVPAEFSEIQVGGYMSVRIDIILGQSYKTFYVDYYPPEIKPAWDGID